MGEGAEAETAPGQQQEEEEPRQRPQQQQQQQREIEQEPETEQQQEKEPKKKRKRRTIACLQCRTRKVRCDLEFPSCGRCAKGPWPDACVYENAGPPTWSATSTLPASRPPSKEQTRPRADADGRDVRGDASSSQLSEEQRIRELERVVLNFAQSQAYAKQGMVMGRLPARTAADSEIQHTPSPHSTQYSRDEATSIPTTARLDVPSRSLPRVKGNKTRFYGLSNVSSLVAEFGDLRAYSKDLKSRFPALANIHNLKALKKDQDQIKKPLMGESALDAVFLSGLLPARSVTYNLVQYYFAFSSSTYHVLHKQTFCDRLQDLYQQPQQASASFVIQLLLVLSIVWSVDAPESVTPSSDKGATVTRNMAMEWIHWGDAWLFHSGIRRPNLILLQTRCLLILAKEANYTQKNQAWAATGTTVKLAMSAGYHRELGPDAKISHFDREMRRRIWSTIMELDLNASFDRGMPPTVQAPDYDTFPPININDEDILESSTQYPEPKHWQIPTDSSFQVTLARSVDLRLRICALVNAPRITISAGQLSELDDELTRHLAEVPRTWENFESTDLRQRQRVMLWRALIDTQLRRSQLCLHSCCALSDLPPSVSNYSWRARLEVAMEMLCQQHQVVEQLGRLAWPLLTDITFQAALTLCHYMYKSDRGFASYLIQAKLPAMTECLIALVEKTLPHLESKYLILEKGMREYCYFCFIISMVKAKRWPESALLHQRLAVDRISSMCYSILSRSNGSRDQDGDAIKMAAITDTSGSTATMPIPASSLHGGQLSSNSSDIADFGVFGEWDFLFGDFTTDFSGFGEI
ncbi:hypothetical protein MGYG_05744 [Nannizzia gypsea CBS 118893]|uniref:Zn(2)-C6 fungal-type domain-containing protein n=1 Tax=Arthroderma gypseum (strain ATCC MYA-4604 / CBS 118893) TaxID=535722 RepID=E4UXL1_ARTGP|nr:hypothetical protein MGYG_05744 [Nannizzia gypsea CBS 118893]EFR02745.1 hypothetical protein MGYG_05744 [Nannizzia gypsea CBS 118893]